MLIYSLTVSSQFFPTTVPLHHHSLSSLPSPLALLHTLLAGLHSCSFAERRMVHLSAGESDHAIYLNFILKALVARALSSRSVRTRANAPVLSSCFLPFYMFCFLSLSICVSSPLCLLRTSQKHCNNRCFANCILIGFIKVSSSPLPPLGNQSVRESRAEVDLRRARRRRHNTIQQQQQWLQQVKSPLTRFISPSPSN